MVVNKRGMLLNDIWALCMSQITSQALKMALEELFSRLVHINVGSQGYNGASNMRDEFNGLKSLIMKHNGYACYVHCFPHQRHLC